MRQSQEKKEWYKLIEKEFLKKQLECWKTWPNKGSKWTGRIDVIGIRDMGGYLHSQYEVICIEVKPDQKRFMLSLGQVYSYSLVAHRCYLAVNTDGFMNEDVHLASKLGVGLIKFSSSNVMMVIESNYFIPDEGRMRDLLWNLGLVRCNICNLFYDKEKTGLVREGYMKDAQNIAFTKKKIYAFDIDSPYDNFFPSEGRNAEERDKNKIINICPNCLRRLQKKL